MPSSACKKRLRIAQREAVALIVCQRFAVGSCGRIPELAQEPCSPRVVPNVDCDDAPRNRNAAHFLEGTFRLRNVIQPQTADDSIEAAFIERKSHRIPGFEADRGTIAMLASKSNLLGRCIHTRNPSGREAVDNGLCEDTAS